MLKLTQIKYILNEMPFSPSDWQASEIGRYTGLLRDWEKILSYTVG